MQTNNNNIIQNSKTALTISLGKMPIIKEDKSFKQKIFNIAENAIIMLIVGIIAILTITSLKSKYQKEAYIIRLKKAYSQLKKATLSEKFIQHTVMNMLEYSTLNQAK